MRSTRFFPSVCALICAISLTASPVALANDEDTGQETSKSDLGTIIGAGLGALLGSTLGGDNKVVGTAVGALLGGFLGNEIGGYLDEQDRQQMAAITKSTIETGQANSWTNPDTKVAAKTRVVETTKKTKPVKVKVLKKKVKKVPPLDMLGETFKAKRGSNIRGGPGTDYVVVGKLKSSQVVSVVGQVKGKPWYLISEDGIGSGFVYSSLLVPAPEDEPTDTELTYSEDDVSEEQVASTQTCRKIEQTVSLPDGRTETETLTACQEPTGWKVQT